MDPSGKLKKRKKTDIVRERKLFRRCGECANCLRAECGICKHCLDMPKFGGSYKLKKACIGRECEVAKRSKQDPNIKKICQMEKMKIVKNSLSVTYDNGKIVKYRSGEKMHNGKILIISRKEDKDIFLAKSLKPAVLPSMAPRRLEPATTKPNPDVDLDIDEFVNKYLQVYYEDRSLGDLDDSATLDTLEDSGTIDSNMDLSPDRLDDFGLDDKTADTFPGVYGIGGGLEVGLGLIGSNRLVGSSRIIGSNRLIGGNPVTIGALKSIGTNLQEVGSNLAKEFCHLCTFNSKCGNCIINTALKEIGNTIDV